MKRVHFLGIGGVGMAGVAVLLESRGCAVSGCDLHASARTHWLESLGIPVATGHSPSHLEEADEIVATPAVPRSNPEFAQARNVRFRGEVLAEIVNASDGIAVCGTHGKTTTATFTTKLLRALGDDPSWCIGGETGDMPVAGVGTGPLVVEADESDGTLALYKARTIVVTCIDYDHPEHFPTQAAYRACYETAMNAATDVIRAWELSTSDWPELPSLVHGSHNISNARAAIEVALRRGHSREAVAAALPQALDRLPDRRFQQVCQGVYTDYAHHPAELACAVGMAAALHPRRLRVIFQPHRYSRTRTLLHDFPAAFDAAQEVVLVPVYPAFEEPIPGGDIADLYKAFRDRPHGDGTPTTILARSAEEAWRHVFLTREPGDAILVAGAGDVIDLMPRIREDMANAAPRSQRTPVSLDRHSFFRTGGVTYGGGAVLPVGMGSNMWFSDCAADIELAEAPTANHEEPELVPAGAPGASLVSRHRGLAFMAGVPGTVGGWTKMNAGAFGHSFGECVDFVVADGRRIPAAECGFGYRTSSIPGLITAVALNMRVADADCGGTPADFLSRRPKFPPRTCGSVFRNPQGDSAGRLLDAAGAKGMRVGGAEVWSGHANVIVAREGCTSSDILALARLMAAAVRERFGVALEPEIRGLDECWQI